MFLHNLKKSVAENMIRLPNGVNMALASLNRNPDRGFGRTYSFGTISFDSVEKRDISAKV